jgi:hypothetical protein
MAIKITFDKLDKKCIQELPLLVDVISSTYNKLKIQFDEYYDEVLDILSKTLKKKKWYLHNREHKNVFYPFTGDDYSNQRKITTLNNYFYMENYFYLYKGNYYKPKDYCNIEFGHCLEDFTCAYFGIYRNWQLNKYGLIYPYNFYEKIRKSIKNEYIKTILYHPEHGDEEEHFQIYCRDFDIQKIDKTFEIFKIKILIPFLNNLP